MINFREQELHLKVTQGLNYCPDPDDPPIPDPPIPDPPPDDPPSGGRF